MMTHDEFDKLFYETIEKLAALRNLKGNEYVRNNDPFHNFNVGARRTNQLRERVLEGFALKHEISIDDMLHDLEQGILPKREVVEEKFNDVLLYLVLKKISVLARLNEAE